MTSETAPNVNSKRCIGQVKWFNNKAGYGFITTSDEEKNDIFTHYSNIQVDNSQYKYLVQGEYVEFNMSESTNTNHKFQATNITGIQQGKLMCETRLATKAIRPPQTRKSKQKRTQESSEQDDGFTKVEKKKQ